MSISDVLLIITTGLGPLIAVQVTRYLDDKKERNGRKLQIFKTLMSTRAYTISLAHAEALNRIDLEFTSKNKNEKNVLNVWQEYLDHLGSKSTDGQAWSNRQLELLVELLYAMGKSLGYDFNKTQIKNGTYSPTAHGRVELEQEKIRQLILEILEGKRDLPIEIKTDKS